MTTTWCLKKTAADMTRMAAFTNSAPLRAMLESSRLKRQARRFSAKFDTEDLGSPSGYTCPDCNGSLIALSDGNYRCRVGHAWTPDALLRASDDEVETALWVAMRSLQEKAKLSHRMAEQVGAGLLRDRYQAIADETEHAMTVLGTRLSDIYTRDEEPGG